MRIEHMTISTKRLLEVATKLHEARPEVRLTRNAVGNIAVVDALSGAYLGYVDLNDGTVDVRGVMELPAEVTSK